MAENSVVDQFTRIASRCDIIMRGTGRYNLAQGAIATMQGIGASLSGLAAGEIVDHFGYSPTFLTLGGAAMVALIVFATQMPETVERTNAPAEKALSQQ
jgi:sugar phosphate permease